MGIGWDEDVIVHDDGLARCGWCGTDPLYVTYHDTEWGVLEHDGRRLFEKLSLDIFQAGLSWLTILRKRPAFREAFAAFDPERVAAFGEADITRLLQDAGIVRNRAKVEATIGNARALLEMGGPEAFSRFLWNFVDGRPLVNLPYTKAEVPAFTPLSERVAQALRQKGFRFCGPTVIYAFMQAVGMVDDHLATCHRARKEDHADGE